MFFHMNCEEIRFRPSQRILWFLLGQLSAEYKQRDYESRGILYFTSIMKKSGRESVSQKILGLTGSGSDQSVRALWHSGLIIVVNTLILSRLLALKKVSTKNSSRISWKVWRKRRFWTLPASALPWWRPSLSACGSLFCGLRRAALARTRGTESRNTWSRNRCEWCELLFFLETADSPWPASWVVLYSERSDSRTKWSKESRSGYRDM